MEEEEIINNEENLKSEEELEEIEDGNFSANSLIESDHVVEEDFDAMPLETLKSEIAKAQREITALEIDLGVDEKPDEDEVPPHPIDHSSLPS